jgi:hypothetical protein
LACVREGLEICVALYGHAGVFAYPGHEAVRRARLEGYSARMLPGISAEDCLFADLGIDPGRNGCQSFGATDFLVARRRFDPCSPLILWQIAVCGEMGHTTECCVGGLRILVEILLHHYSDGHEVVLYEASKYIGFEPVIQRIALASVPEANMSMTTTLYVPPRSRATCDLAMAARLGMPRNCFMLASDDPSKCIEE